MYETLTKIAIEEKGGCWKVRYRSTQEVDISSATSANWIGICGYPLVGHGYSFSVRRTLSINGKYDSDRFYITRKGKGEFTSV